MRRFVQMFKRFVHSNKGDIESGSTGAIAEGKHSARRRGMNEATRDARRHDTSCIDPPRGSGVEPDSTARCPIDRNTNKR
jgi:hypothetical protein